MCTYILSTQMCMYLHSEYTGARAEHHVDKVSVVNGAGVGGVHLVDHLHHLPVRLGLT